jgi:hypothetical protein
MATINADEKNLPLYWIAKGKTKRVEISRLGEVGIYTVFDFIDVRTERPY